MRNKGLSYPLNKKLGAFPLLNCFIVSLRSLLAMSKTNKTNKIGF